MCSESWDDIALYGRNKLPWLRTFLDLPNGIPSHDTFRRVFMLIDPRPRPALRRQPHNHAEVAQAHRHRRCRHGTQGAPLHRSDIAAGGYDLAFRRHTLLPLGDCLYALQPSIPHLTRLTLHRCLERHGISRLPSVDGDKPAKKKFKSYPIGYFHIDIAEVRTEQGKLRLFVGIDRTSKFAFVRTIESAGKMEAADFLREMIQAVPYRIHTVLTDNGVQFTARKQDIWDSQHIFDCVCDEHDSEHRLTKVNHPWTNGQVERMNRTIREATVKRYHYDTHDQLRGHLQLFVDAYNHARRLKTLRGLTPGEFIHQT